MYFRGNYISGEIFRPGCYFTDSDMDMIIDGSLKILENIGIKIVDDSLRNTLSVKGFGVKGNRVLIEKQNALKYLEMWKKQPEKMRSKRRYYHDYKTGFNCTLNEHCTNLLYNDRLEPFTLESAVYMTKLVEKLSVQYNFSPNVAGCPNDVPNDLKSLACFMIAAKYCHKGYPDEPETRVAADYMFKMAEVIDYKINKLTVFVATPLTLGGESLSIAMEYKEKVPIIKVTSMPSFGANTPHNIPAAFSLALAEVLGSAVIVNSLTGVFCDFLVQMHPFDFRELSLVYGSPEQLIFEWINGEFNARLLGRNYSPSRTNIHTHAKEPGLQSSVEKASLIMAGAFHGATTFNGAGALSLDEIFSPVQLVLDLEILSHVWRAVRGAKREAIPENLLEVISKGLDSGYIATDMTLDNISEFIWTPEIFERTSLATALKRNSNEMSRINDILDKIQKMDDAFVLEEEKAKELDRLWKGALSDSRIRS